VRALGMPDRWERTNRLHVGLAGSADGARTLDNSTVPPGSRHTAGNRPDNALYEPPASPPRKPR